MVTIILNVSTFFTKGSSKSCILNPIKSATINDGKIVPLASELQIVPIKNNAPTKKIGTIPFTLGEKFRCSEYCTKIALHIPRVPILTNNKKAEECRLSLEIIRVWSFVT